jgi:hypothetical protein
MKKSINYKGNELIILLNYFFHNTDMSICINQRYISNLILPNCHYVVNGPVEKINIMRRMYWFS